MGGMPEVEPWELATIRKWVCRAGMRSLALAACGWCIMGCAAVPQVPPPVPAPAPRPDVLRRTGLDVPRQVPGDLSVLEGSTIAWQLPGPSTAAVLAARQVPAVGAVPGHLIEGDAGSDPAATLRAGPPPALPIAAKDHPELPALPWSIDKTGWVTPSDDREVKYLQPLFLEESRLLADFGPEHPAVTSVHERISAVRKYLEQHPTPAAADAGPKPAPPAPSAQAPLAATSPRGGDTRIEVFPVTVVLHAEPKRPPAEAGAAKLNHPAVEWDAKATSSADRAPADPPALQGRRPAEGQGPKPGREEQAVGRGGDSDDRGKQPSSSTSVPAFSHPAGREAPVVLPGVPRADSIPLSFLRISEDQVLFGSVLLAGLLAHLAALMAFARWYGRRLARRIRAELSGEGAGQSGGQLADRAPRARIGPVTEVVSRGAADVAATRPGGNRKGERGGPGLSVDGELPGKAPDEAGQEEALLRQVFEDNLRLRDELASMVPLFESRG